MEKSNAWLNALLGVTVLNQAEGPREGLVCDRRQRATGNGLAEQAFELAVRAEWRVKLAF
jgi:hypothetical protein